MDMKFNDFYHNENKYMNKIMPDFDQMSDIHKMPVTKKIPVSVHIPAKDQITSSDQKRCIVTTFET